MGIGYPTDNQEEIVRLRYFDLTPPTPDDLIPVHFNVPKTGGRDAFFDFIDNQVKPEVEKRFNVDKATGPVRPLSGRIVHPLCLVQPHRFLPEL